jgi:wobble nucleotide-excising tRNase
MIKKIDIKKYGLFNNYVWDTTIGQAETFRKQNIIYGRNYSGKTTLARIFKSIEDGQLHKNYQDCEFSVTLNDGRIIDQTNLLSFGSEIKIRVYNTDFVTENLSWLHNNDGTIKPFTILGAKNVELDKQIKEIEEKIGSEENSKGLTFELSEQKKEFIKRKAEYDIKKNELDSKLRIKAQSIKNNAALYNYPTYQINTIKSDISNLTEISILSDEQIDIRKKLLKEESKGNLEMLIESTPKFSTYFSETYKLVKRSIKTSQPISDLINDALLQEWVRQGIDKHKGERKNCGFCGNVLSNDLWDKLDAHFNKESEDLRIELKMKISELEKAKEGLLGFLTINKEMFYITLTSKYEEIFRNWNKTSNQYSKSIDNLIEQIKAREKDIFKEFEIKEIDDQSEKIFELIKEFNSLIIEHNLKTSTLSKDQEKARLELRISDVGKFANDIDYNRKIAEANLVLVDANNLDAAKNLKSIEVENLLEEKRKLEAQAKDESKGAELVNQHLTHFFGHDELKLVAEGSSPNIKFKVNRDNIDANNLSEGECSLISFCYFIAKMEDEMKDDLNIDKLLIYIDDPISSLDSNHIFFMFSLIESIIAKPKKYGQLFISTHNLDFLKYLKKLTQPEKYQLSINVKKNSGLQHFFIERKEKKNTYLKLAPEYLKNYITEFNYLFNQIYKCSNADSETIAHNYQYNFGNNMRKFLEAYLFYKYPSHNLSLDKRLDKFFESDLVTINLINRVVNEYSHLGEHFDRGLEPMDVEAICKISKSVISRIQMTDPNQFTALLESLTD